MKIALDLTSVLTGGAAALVLGLVAGFSPQVTSVPAATPATPVATVGASRPAARDIVHLQAKSEDGAPVSGNAIPGTGYSSPIFTVPAGKILVLTSMSLSEQGGLTDVPGILNVPGAVFTIDGVPNRFNGNSSLGNSLPFSVGIPVTEGQTVQVLKSNYAVNRRSAVVNLHGYLEDA